MAVFICVGNDVCPNCESKDNNEMYNLKNFVSENPITSIELLSHQTGISITNLNRFIQKDDFSMVRKELKKQI